MIHCAISSHCVPLITLNIHVELDSIKKTTILLQENKLQYFLELYPESKTLSPANTQEINAIMTTSIDAWYMLTYSINLPYDNSLTYVFLYFAVTLVHFQSM